mmetsp:Transcript_34185/g.102027  ORF Transcript_34185/g.102027 Transcript_34185/m.102027 type:complete len:214 (+) Transcript_34185:280-921(+)
MQDAVHVGVVEDSSLALLPDNLLAAHPHAGSGGCPQAQVHPHPRCIPEVGSQTVAWQQPRKGHARVARSALRDLGPARQDLATCLGGLTRARQQLAVLDQAHHGPALVARSELRQGDLPRPVQVVESAILQQGIQVAAEHVHVGLQVLREGDARRVPDGPIHRPREEVGIGVHRVGRGPLCSTEVGQPPHQGPDVCCLPQETCSLVRRPPLPG